MSLDVESILTAAHHVVLPGQLSEGILVEVVYTQRLKARALTRKAHTAHDGPGWTG